MAAGTTGVKLLAPADDENYSEYDRLLGGLFIGAAPSRLQRGLGVFGSIVPVVQRQLTIR